MKKQFLYVTEDGRTFTDKAEAIDHEIKLTIAYDLVQQLKMNTKIAHVVSQNYKNIIKIIGNVSGSKGKKALQTEED